MIREYINDNGFGSITLTVCTRSLAQFYVVTYYMEWGKTYWTYSTKIYRGIMGRKGGKIGHATKYLVKKARVFPIITLL